MTHLCITLRFLTSSYHGKISNNQQEWPPSPLRLFQALLCAAAYKWRGESFSQIPEPVLAWLEQLPPPQIVAPEVTLATGYRSYVPDNVGDLVAAGWSRGSEKDISGYRTEKDIRPHYLHGDDPVVKYIWTINENVPAKFMETVELMAHSVTHLGWGVDMVVGHAEIVDTFPEIALHEELWSPSYSVSAKVPLRIPQPGVLVSLLTRHAAFLSRVAHDDSGEEFFQPVPGIKRLKLQPYRRATDPVPLRFLAFDILETDASRYRPFSTERSNTVTGMLRHALVKFAKDKHYPQQLIDQLILGHAEKPGEKHQPVEAGHIQIVPLPSIENRSEQKNFNHIGMIRRALLVFPHTVDQHRFDEIKYSFSGKELLDEKTGHARAMVTLIPKSKYMIQRYAPTNGASTWSTVTPMILPGQDDRKASKTEKLIRKAMLQVGLPEQLVRLAEIDWRKSGYWSGADYAHKDRYQIPTELQKFPLYHIRIIFRDELGQSCNIPGPLILGSGRYKGLGLFAAE